jgi:hypothetical protein
MVNRNRGKNLNMEQIEKKYNAENKLEQYDQSEDNIQNESESIYEERDRIRDILLETLNITKDRIENGGVVFCVNDIDEQKKNVILDLKAACKKCFLTRNWPIFRLKYIKNDWLSLTKNILKANNYNIYLCKINGKNGSIVQAYYVTTKYII